MTDLGIHKWGKFEDRAEREGQLYGGQNLKTKHNNHIEP
jgi:hypothetical protein